MIPKDECIPLGRIRFFCELDEMPETIPLTTVDASKVLNQLFPTLMDVVVTGLGSFIAENYDVQVFSRTDSFHFLKVIHCIGRKIVIRCHVHHYGPVRPVSPS